MKKAICQAWNGNQSQVRALTLEKLKRCRSALSKWKQENNSNSLTRISQARAALELEQSSGFPRNDVVWALKNDLCKANQDEETFWSQKSRAKWMHCGDMNTPFFHASVKDNRGKQCIEQLFDINGNLHKDETTKGVIAVAYFKELFKSSNPSSFLDLFEDYPARVTDGMNAVLTRSVSKNEVREAVFGIRSSSAPGADGFTGFFF